MSASAGTPDRYDAYWSTRDRARTEARSRERARAVLSLLERRRLGAGRLLDAGCGPGWALETFREAGHRGVGIDASPAAVEEARARGCGQRESDQPGFDVRVLDLEGAEAGDILTALDGPFDYVVALEVLEHLLDPAGALRTLGALLRPGGHLIVSLPNEIHVPARAMVVLGRLPFGGHEDPHVRHFDRRAARRLLADAGARVLEERPISVVPPRYRALRLLAAPLVGLLPGAFALSTVYLLEGPAHD